MDLDELDFPLPEALIARHPARERREARLMVVQGGAWQHRGFADLPALLAPGDVLVLNDTRVLPARLRLRKETGGQVEGLFLRETSAGRALCLLSGGRLRPGVVLQGAHSQAPSLRLVAKGERGTWELAVEPGMPWPEALAKLGEAPLPPYIRRMRREDGEAESSTEDQERYQSIWAAQAGSVAAPTASLHFDQAMLEALKARDIAQCRLTLHVGRGTFLPIETARVEDHPMHAERFDIPASVAAQLQDWRKEGRRIIAVGTTVCRALEAWAAGDRGETRLMILPGHRFQLVDGLLTNFHTPRSTLLALVAAMAQAQGAPKGLDLVKAAYAEAVKEAYRFYSYGDASLWLPRMG